MSSSTTSGRSARPPRSPASAVVRRDGLVAVELQQHRERLRAVLVVVDDRMRRRAAPPRGVGSRGDAGRGRARPAIGRRTTNSLPLAESRAVRLDRAAVHLHQRLHQREADAEAAVRALERRSTCVNISKTRSSCVGGMPMPLSRTRDHGLARRPRSTVSRDRAARSRVLAGVVEQVAEHLRQPRRVGVAGRSAPAGSVTVELVAQRSASGRRRPRRPARSPAPARRARVRSSRRSCVMRLMSSRSSTRRTIWPSCRSIMSTRAAGPPSRRRPRACRTSTRC